MALAGDLNTYSFRLCKVTENGLDPQEDGFDLVRVSHFIGEVLAKPPQAMVWTGFRDGLRGVFETLTDDPNAILEAQTWEEIEAALKERGASPNHTLRKAGDRGNAAHKVLELMAAGETLEAGKRATQETMDFGTRYGQGVITFWNEAVQPYLDNGEVTEVLSEKRVWSLKHGFCGTFDLGLKWEAGYWSDGTDRVAGWTIEDLKTHKPSSGFTKPGHGPAYISDVVQIRAYRMAFEEMGLGKTIGQRVIVARDNGKWLGDTREIREGFVTYLRELYDQRSAFENGEVA